MANLALSSKTIKFAFKIFFLAITLKCATSARILDEAGPQPSTLTNTLIDGTDVTQVSDPMTTLPSGQIPAIGPPAADPAPLPGPDTTLPTTPAQTGSDIPDTVPAPATDMAPLPVPDTTLPTAPTQTGSDIPHTVPPPAADLAPLPEPDTTVPTTPAQTASDVSTTVPPPVADVAPTAVPVVDPPSVTAAPEHPQVTFFMHDILGGSHPSGRVVTGIVANSDVNNLPFSKTNNRVFPISGGVPLNTINGAINNNNAPFLVGLNGSPASTILQNSGNNNGAVSTNNNNLPFVTAGQLPTGLTLQQLMFGSVTVVDNEMTEGHELGTGVIGKTQGFYLSSSLDGTSHTLVLTALFHGNNETEVVDDTISFFGIHRTGSPVSEIAVIGGTGKYEDARGYATIEALPQQDQHTTDGVETITQFNVYLTPN